MAKTYSCLLIGLNVVEIEIETMIGAGFSGLTILGLRSDVTRDMRERIRSALESIGIPIPAKRVIVNISSQEFLKLSRTPIQELDFSVAASIILALFKDQNIPLPDIGKEFFGGELTLTGQIKFIQNFLIYKKLENSYSGKHHVLISLHHPNTKEISEFKNYESLGRWLEERKYKNHNSLKENSVKNIKHEPELNILENQIEHTMQTIKILLKNPVACVSILVAVAGHHHLLLAGEPGIGKSFSIQNIKNILLPPTSNQQIEIKLIHTNSSNSHLKPFRTPHHSSTTAALIGGQSLKPGEVTLAHHGVLFLDEIAEFSRPALEALREPLDSGKVELSKSAGSVCYPAHFLLCATTNPCPCGYLLSPNIPCRCKPTDSRQYIAKLSGPLLDRFCLQVWMKHPNSIVENEIDIFSKYLLSLDNNNLYKFAKNFLNIQSYDRSVIEPNEQDNDYGNQISLRAQTKLSQLKITFRQLFPDLCHDHNFSEHILMYRNLQKMIHTNLV